MELCRYGNGAFFVSLILFLILLLSGEKETATFIYSCGVPPLPQLKYRSIFNCNARLEKKGFSLPVTELLKRIDCNDPGLPGTLAFEKE